MELKHMELVSRAPVATAVPPMRLMLLGTAGTGKTQSVKTLLQELKRVLKSAKYEGHFVRVAAPTGCAAFNVRFGATTLHRLFQMLRPNKFAELQEDGSVQS
jgi:Cdc6-like AAA superfamily ATPase